MSEAKKIAGVFPVLKEVWEARYPEYEQWLEDMVRDGMELLGEVVSPLIRSVHEEAEIAGIRLFEVDEDGNPLPPRVLVRYEAMAVPHAE